MQCGDWIQLKILEVIPELTALGATLQEAAELQKAHDEVLRQLQVIMAKITAIHSTYSEHYRASLPVYLKANLFEIISSLLVDSNSVKKKIHRLIISRSGMWHKVGRTSS